MKSKYAFIVLVLMNFTLPVQAQPSTTFDSKYFDKLQWRNIGPQRGGRSLAATGVPGRPNEYYFGATGGGLWKTTDGGQEWAPVTDGKISSSSIGAVAVAASNPDVIYIGGGETQLRGSIIQGDGVYKSIDAGKTWKHVGLRETQAISRIRIHPANPDIVFVAALGHPYGDNEERGVFKSTDGGTTWKKILYASPKAGAVDLIIDPINPDILYASTWQVYRKTWTMWSGGDDCKLWKSTDGGTTWNDLTKNPGMPELPIGKIGITVSPVDNKRLWAIIEANEGGVYRSDDAGGTWKKMNEDNKLRQRAFYFSRIYADPVDRETVYCLNVDFWKSTDGGLKFERIRGRHNDRHDLWIDPKDPQRMILADDGGASVSVNGGKTWTEQDYATSQFYHVTTTNHVPYMVAGAQQDNSTIAIQNSGFNAANILGEWGYWVGGGESGYIASDPKNPNIFYAGSQEGLLTRVDVTNMQYRDVQVYPRIFSGEPSSALPQRFQWTFPIVFSPKDSRMLFTCSQHVWLTKNEGQSWEKISPDLTYADPATLGVSGGIITKDMNGPEIYATVFALAPSHHDINTIWAGSDDGKMHITRDGGKNWINITPKELPKHSVVSIIDESKHDPGVAYVAAYRYQVDDREPYVFRTRDYGKTWTKIISGISTGHFSRSIREDHIRKGLLFLGTEHGVYVSFNAGDNWQPLQLNLPNTPVRDLVIKDNDVVLGTHGRGFWILDNIQPLRQIIPEMINQRAILFQPDDAIRGLDDAVIQYYLKEKADSVVLEILDEKGKLVQRFAGFAPQPKSGNELNAGQLYPTTAEGLNSFAWKLRYPGALIFDDMIIVGARPQNGPKAPPGKYQVRLTVGNIQQTSQFKIKKYPNLKGISDADLKESFDLAMKIRDRESEANGAVINIRNIRKQLDGALKNNSDSATIKATKNFISRINAVEERLYQTKNRSEKDVFNFPIRLGNRISALRASLERGDQKPTDGLYKVFDELSKELDGHLMDLNKLLSKELPALKKQLDLH